MSRRAYLYFVLTFVLGVIVGSVGFFSYAWYSGHWHQRFSKQRMIGFLKHELKLSDSQIEQLRPIVDEWEKKQADLRSRIDPQFQSLREEFRNHVRQVLNPEQIAKFDQMVRCHDERMKKFR